MSYAWIIDRDHLAEEERRNSGYAEDDSAGRMGPSDGLPRMFDHLKALRAKGVSTRLPTWETFTFKLYDDDGILYYSGKLVTDEGATEQACYGPLGDFGSPNAGCTEIKYPGHPEMDCG